ncbi:MAG: hypothetical protein ABIP64_05525, partial [Burkholderiales bacterium]
MKKAAAPALDHAPLNAQELAPLQVRCAPRANCENRIKELKYDFAADSFNRQDFWTTEAAPNTVMLAY